MREPNHEVLLSQRGLPARYGEVASSPFLDPSTHQVESRLGLARVRVGNVIELLGERVGAEAAAFGPLLSQECVAKGS